MADILNETKRTQSDKPQSQETLGSKLSSAVRSVEDTLTAAAEAVIPNPNHRRAIASAVEAILVPPLGPIGSAAGTGLAEYISRHSLSSATSTSSAVLPPTPHKGEPSTLEAVIAGIAAGSSKKILGEPSLGSTAILEHIETRNKGFDFVVSRGGILSPSSDQISVDRGGLFGGKDTLHDRLSSSVTKTMSPEEQKQIAEYDKKFHQALSAGPDMRIGIGLGRRNTPELPDIKDYPAVGKRDEIVKDVESKISQHAREGLGENFDSEFRRFARGPQVNPLGTVPILNPAPTGDVEKYIDRLERGVSDFERKVSTSKNPQDVIRKATVPEGELV
jgi:hypothetical protein